MGDFVISVKSTAGSILDTGTVHAAIKTKYALILSLGLKRPGREADYSPPSSAEVKVCVELYLHSRNKPSWRVA